jgi:putative membrane protein
MKFVRFLSLPVLAVIVAACGGPEAKTVTTTTSQTPAPEPAPVAATKPAEPGMGGTNPDLLPPITPTALSDEQIAAISGAANRGEVDQAKLATEKSKNPKIKKFAAMMAAHHGEANTKSIDMLRKAHITPEESTVSTQMTTESSKLVESLKPMNGPEFDRAYIDAQVKEHTAILDAFDTKMLPVVKNADLKSDLTAMRAKIDGHLKEAQAIQKSLPTPVPAK